LKIIEGQPTVYDLPTGLPFELRAYNSLTSHYVTLEIAFSYDAGNSRHIGVPKAIETKAIMSVCAVSKNKEHHKEKDSAKELENKAQDEIEENINSKLIC
ncbi:4623_t:CDS:2, partial [Gigaspora rosea]